MKNMIGMEIRELGHDEFYAMVEHEVQDTVAHMLTQEGTTGMVVFENIDMSSSNFGHRTFLVYGPSRSNGNLIEATRHHIGDVPSRFDYPVAYYEPK